MSQVLIIHFMLTILESLLRSEADMIPNKIDDKYIRKATGFSIDLKDVINIYEK